MNRKNRTNGMESMTTGLKGITGACMALFLCLFTGPVLAATITVDTNLDDGSLGNCELRDAIIAANTNVAADTCVPGTPSAVQADTIVFNLSAGNETITLVAGELLIQTDGNLTIDGSNNAGSGGLVTVSGNNASRVFHTTVGPVTFDSLTVTGGNSAANGGCFFLEGNGNAVNISNTVIDTCVSTNTGVGNGGGGIASEAILNIGGTLIQNNTALGMLANGGGILNLAGGTVDISVSTLFNNQAARAGGGIEMAGGNVGIVDSNLSNNTANINGGGVHVTTGDLVMNGGLVSNNVALQEGGGLWNNAGATMTLINTSATLTISDNDAQGNAGPGTDLQGGGGIFNNGGDMNIIEVDPNDAFGILITGNTASGTGGSAAGSGGGIMTIGGTVQINNVRIDGNEAVRAGGGIEIVDGTLNMDGSLSGTLVANDVSNNDLTGNGLMAAPGNGGGIHVTGGTVNLDNYSVTNNVAQAEGGGLWNNAGFTMTVTDSLISANTASGDLAPTMANPDQGQGGGGIFNHGGTLIVSGSQIGSNIANGTAGSGGGIFNNSTGGVTGTTTISGTNLDSNIANRAGGGIEIAFGTGTTMTATDVTFIGNNAGVPPNATPAPGNGGGLHISGSSDVFITNTPAAAGVIQSNVADREGGGLWNGGGTMTITGNGETIQITDNTARGGAEADTAQGGDGGGGIFNNGGTVFVTNANISDNSADSSSTNSAGTAGSGGGILNSGNGTLQIDDSTITGNTAVRAGGGIEVNAASNTNSIIITNSTISANSTGPSPGNGGGIHITGAGESTIDRSTVTNNTAAREGGGLWNHNAGDMDVVNSTIQGNTGSDVGGGGIFQQAGGGTASLLVLHSTVAGNMGGANGGGILNAGGATQTVTIDSTIVADNTATADNDISGTITSGDYNLVENVGGAVFTAMANDITGVDPQLAPLGDYGGDTLTQAINTASPAYDQARGVCNPSPVNAVDQRGEPRPGAGSAACDIGAFEYNGEPSLAVLDRLGGGMNSVTPGTTDVPVLAAGLSNSSTVSIDVSAFTGTATGSCSVGDEIASAAFFLDNNNDQVFNAGDTSLAGAGTLSLNTNADTFTFTFNTPRTIAAGVTENYALSVDFANFVEVEDILTSSGNLLVAGLTGLLMLPLLILLALGRGVEKVRLLLAGLLMTAVITGCSGSSDNDDDGDSQCTVQITLQAVTAQQTGGGTVLVSPLPLAGPLTVAGVQ